jgi:hypothetical protein
MNMFVKIVENVLKSLGPSKMRILLFYVIFARVIIPNVLYLFLMHKVVLELSQVELMGAALGVLAVLAHPAIVINLPYQCS